MTGSKFKSLYFEYQLHPFHRPPEMRGSKRRHTVVIVGGGPVGLALALELAQRNVASVVLEAGDSVSEGSRAICFSRRTLEILEPLGVAAAVEAKGLPWTGGKSYYKDRLVYQLAMPHAPEERYFPMYNLQQCWLEQFLIDQVEQTAAIDLRWQNRLEGVDAGTDGVRLTVATPEGDYILEADYVVAADGARSTVRQAMGLKLNGNSYEGRYLIADIKMVSDHPAERRAWFNPPSNPASTVLMHRQPDDIWRIDYQLHDDEDAAAELEEGRIRQRIQDQLDMIGETAPWQLDWYSIYKAHCRCLDSYNHGRVLFAGDAAHLVPIFGVRGLNSGMADAQNLGWKLALVIRGLAPEALLESYNQERREATLEVFREAGKSTTFMTPPSRGYQLMREAALSLAVSHELTRPLVNPRQSEPYDYITSPLNTGQKYESDFRHGRRIGAPVRDILLPDDQGYLQNRLGKYFTFFYFTDSNDLPTDIANVARTVDPYGLLTILTIGKQGGKPGADITDSGNRLFAEHDAVPGTGYLIRPDGHICARWRHVTGPDLAVAFQTALVQSE